jgi:parallel beta-helix repeat protein
VTTATVLCPGDSLAAIVNAAPEGTAFQLRSGVYRLQQFSPKTGQSFTGEAGTVLSGAQLLTEWSQEGAYWVHAGPKQEGEVRLASSCQPQYPACAYPEDLFIDDTLLQRVTSLDQVTADRWYFDSTAGKVYMAEVPTGRRVELSVLPWAIFSDASNVTIQNLTIEKYAAPAQRGAVGYTGPGPGWTVSNNEVRWNHGIGIKIASGMNVLGNFVHHQGQLGIGGTGSAVTVENNEIAYNNTAGFGPGTTAEAGATKFVATDGLVVRGNYSHDNHGPGLWTDINNTGCLIEGNTVEDNDWRGIFHEISYACVIRNNTVRRNGLRFPATGPVPLLEGAGILVSNSADVEVYGNIVEDNENGIGGLEADRGSGPHGVYRLTNLWVHDNSVRQLTGYAAGVNGAVAVFATQNNRFTDNHYVLGDTAIKQFRWSNADQTEQEWQSFGQDVGGTFTR